MALRKQNFPEGKIAKFDEACMYKRGEYCRLRLWLTKENKYTRKRLRKGSEGTAIGHCRAAYLAIYGNLKQGISYFSITTEEGVEKYFSFGKREVELGHIIKGQHATIATNLQYFISLIGKETKLKEVKRLCKEFGFAAAILKGVLAKGHDKK